MQEAEPILRQALDLNRRLDPDSGGGTRNYLALVLEDNGGYQEAGQLLREALEIVRRTGGPNSPDYVLGLHNLAGVEIESGDMSTAEATDRQDLALHIKIQGPNHRQRIPANRG